MRSAAKATIPGGEPQVLTIKEESGGKVDGVETAQVVM